MLPVRCEAHAPALLPALLARLLVAGSLEGVYSHCLLAQQGGFCPDSRGDSRKPGEMLHAGVGVDAMGVMPCIGMTQGLYFCHVFAFCHPFARLFLPMVFLS